MEQKPKRKNKRGLSRFQKIGLGIGISLSLICIGVFAFGVWAASLWSDLTYYADGEEAKKLIENVLNTSIPDSAQEIYVAYAAWQDLFVKMRFTLTPTETELWLSDNEFCFGDLSDIYSYPYFGNGYPHYPDASWWQPERAERSVSDECGNNPYHSILIDQTNSEFWIIYIQVFST